MTTISQNHSYTLPRYPKNQRSAYPAGSPKQPKPSFNICSQKRVHSKLNQTASTAHQKVIVYSKRFASLKEVLFIA